MQGYVEAWFHLGVMYLNGWGVKANPQQALDYFRLAAEMGHILAQYNLAMMHLRGAPKDKCATHLPRKAASGKTCLLPF